MERASGQQRREQLVRLLDGHALVAAVATPEPAEAQVLVDRELADDAVTLRHVTDTEPCDRLRGPADELLVAEHDGAAPRLHEPGDGSDERCLPGAVGAEHCGDAAVRY